MTIPSALAWDGIIIMAVTHTGIMIGIIDIIEDILTRHRAAFIALP
jgi:hypothetical protein